MVTNQEANHLLCSIEVTDLVEVKSFWEALGGKLLHEFEVGETSAAWIQVGAGIVELTEIDHGLPFYPPLSIKLVVDDPNKWNAGLAKQGWDVGDGIGSIFDGRQGFVVGSPAGPQFIIQTPLSGFDDHPLDLTLDPEGPTILHFQTTWWSKHWRQDYNFVSQGLGLVTSRGRSDPEGGRIAFLRAAYEGKAIVEVVDGLNDSYDGPGLHWLVSLVVNDAEGFHQRLLKAGKPVGALGYTNWGALSFTAKCASGPLLFVYQERDGGTPGMVGEPAGLGSM